MMDQASLRITLAIDSLGGGGAERVATDLARHLSAFGHSITLITFKGELADVYPLDPSIKRVRIEIRTYATNPACRLYFLARRVLRMRGAILAQEPDIVISFIDKTNVYVLGALVGSRVPVIVSERIHPAYQPLAPAWTAARWLLYQRATALVVQTAEIARWSVAHLTVRRVVTIPNAVRDAMPRSATHRVLNSDGKLIVAAGRLVEQKGFDLLIDAFARSELWRQGWQLTIAGEGELREMLEQRIQDNGLTDAISMPGFVSDLEGLLRRADIFVLSSRYEGFPNALIEAMQLGIAAISFDCPSGPSDIIRSGENGVLVPREDVVGLTDALVKLAANAALRRSLGQSASHTVTRQLSPATIYGQWNELVRSLTVGLVYDRLSARGGKV